MRASTINSQIAGSRGVEIDYTRLNQQYVPFAGGFNNGNVKAKSSYSISGRLGYLVTPETLFYGRLGYAAIDLEAEEGFDAMASETVGGLKAGFGAETFLFGNVTGRIEANYISTDDFTVAADFKQFDPTYLVVNAGLSYRFGANNGSGQASEPAAAMQFSGFYAGGFGAIGFGKSTLDVLDNPNATAGPYAGDALGFGGFVGYDFLINDRFVIGAEAEAAYVNVKFEDPSMNSLEPEPTALFGTINATYALSARVGFVATPSTLVYVKGGFAKMVVDANEDFFALDSGGTESLSAYQVGAGIESALTDKLTLRVEGVYTEATDSIIADNTQLGQLEIKPSLLSGRIGLAYRF
jgi:outer membrane immunogenic protein